MVADVCKNAIRKPGFSSELVHQLIAKRAAYTRRVREVVGGTKANDDVRTAMRNAAKLRWLKDDDEEWIAMMHSTPSPH